jgi:putative transposase
MRRSDELHLQHPFMGARQLKRDLAVAEIDVGRCHIRTLMQRLDIAAQCPQPGTSKRALGHKIYPYLLRGVAIMCANQVWALDTTYIPMEYGFVYLTAVGDVASRRVLAHKVGTTLEAHYAVEIIERAFKQYGLPKIVNTDQSLPRRRPGAASSPLRSSPAPCSNKGRSSPWTVGARGATTCSSSGFGGA